MAPAPAVSVPTESTANTSALIESTDDAEESEKKSNQNRVIMIVAVVFAVFAIFGVAAFVMMHSGALINADVETTDIINAMPVVRDNVIIEPVGDVDNDFSNEVANMPYSKNRE